MTRSARSACFFIAAATAAQPSESPISVSGAGERRRTVGATVNQVNSSINGFVSSVAEVAFKALPSVFYLALALAALVKLDWRLAAAVCFFR